ncbi:MAG: hypothetical protein AABX70_01865 [Nanoarchaeota archaeon]
MGGCYDSRRYSACSTPQYQLDMNSSLLRFFEAHQVPDLVTAYKSFFDNSSQSGRNSKGGFIKVLLDYRKCAEAPKEFSDLEYEVKFSILPVPPQGKESKEPSVAEYLAALEFPAVQSARFLKDPVDAIAEGNNHFLGQEGNERLVIIEKGGKTYLKEKSQPLPLKTGVPYESIVMKRTEKRYAASIEDILRKVAGSHERGSVYQGYVRKEKGDAFTLDTNDGRIYSMSLTRAHLDGDGAVQRQLELEYAGYVPGFAGFEKDSEVQIVSGMVDLAKHVAFLSNNAPVARGWRMELSLTNERKYDFVKNKGKPREVKPGQALVPFAPKEFRGKVSNGK